MNLKDRTLPVGKIKIEHIDKLTGESIYPLDEFNVITIEGLDNILRNMTEKGGIVTNDSVVSNIVLGDDVGNGSASNPEQPTALSTYLDQSEVLSISESDITKTYPAAGEFTVAALLDGEAIVNQAGVETINYTSATIRFRGGEALSYKRFPVRTISRIINIRITWSISFNIQGET